MEDFDRLSDKQIAENAKREAQERGEKALRRSCEARAAEKLGQDEDSQDAVYGYTEALMDRAQWTWDLYVTGSCICHMDYSSACNCEANDTAYLWLNDLLGPDWHDIMRLAKDHS